MLLLFLILPYILLCFRVDTGGNYLLIAESHFIINFDILMVGHKVMPQQAPVMLTAEQFSQLPTKAYLEERLKDLPTKAYLEERLKDLPTKAYLEERLKDLPTKAYLEERLKDSLKNVATKKDLDSKFDLLDYKLDKSFDHLERRIDGLEEKLIRHTKDINDLYMFSIDHSMRIKKLEFRVY